MKIRGTSFFARALVFLGTMAASATLSSGLTAASPHGLLTGCTVTATNTLSSNCTVPSGWTLVTAQGFESGTSSQVINGTVASGFAHTGNYALGGTYAGDGQQVDWYLPAGAANSREVYVSWWEYDESQGRFNDEMFLMRPFIGDSSGHLLQEVIFDWFGWGASSHSGFNSTDAAMVLEPQGVGATSVSWKKGGTPHWGSWTQWEVHWKANDPGRSNGQAEVYENGQLIDQWTNGNFNGKIDMTRQAIEIGGVYTKLTWWNGRGSFSPPGSCTSYIGQGTDSGPRVTDFSKPCPCMNQCPANGYVPIFKRYFDDIIVLKK